MRLKMDIIDGEIVGSRAVRFLEWVKAIGVGEVVSRQMMAERMNCNYSTARYHLERATLEGWLNKQYGYASERQPGWVYALPETMPRLEGM
jgi:hypothetical protein